MTESPTTTSSIWYFLCEMCLLACSEVESWWLAYLPSELLLESRVESSTKRGLLRSLLWGWGRTEATIAAAIVVVFSIADFGKGCYYYTLYNYTTQYIVQSLYCKGKSFFAPVFSEWDKGLGVHRDTRHARANFGKLLALLFFLLRLFFPQRPTHTHNAWSDTSSSTRYLYQVCMPMQQVAWLGSTMLPIL